jgi:pimeloyl-ACP methyl ester carboxylesterase
MNLFDTSSIRDAIRSTRTVIQATLEGSRVSRKTDFSCCVRPVLLVYGFGTTRRSLSVLEKRLRKDGFDVFSLNMGSLVNIMLTGNIPWRAALVAKKIEKLYKRNPGMGPLTVIGHSEGGVVGRYYIQMLGGDRRVKMLITLASPHNGTRLAIMGALSIGAIARDLFQLIPGSPFMRKLARTAFPRGVGFYSIYSPDDWICPPAACRAVDASGREVAVNIEIPGLGHNDFLLKKNPYKVVRRIMFGLPVRESEAMFRAACEPQEA